MLRSGSFVRSVRTLGFIAVGMVAFLLGIVGPAQATDDVGLVDGNTGLWYLRDADTGSTTSFYYGNPGDRPFVGDWDCDGIETPGLYRQSDGYVYLRNSNTQGIADIRFFFGNPGDVPIAGDWDGDGCDTVSIYRPSNSRVHIINELGADGEGLGAADFFYTFGKPGDIPVVGDVRGDGTDVVNLLRPDTNELFLAEGLSARVVDVIAMNDGETPLIGDWVSTNIVAKYDTGAYSFALPGVERYEYGSPRMIPIVGEFGSLPGTDDPPPNPPPYPDVGSGKRIIYSNGQQRIWLIDENNVLVDTYLVSGKKGIPYNGTYAVFSKSVNAWAPYGGITMKHMVRFVRPGTWGNQWSYGFHSIPEYPGGRPMQTEAQLGVWRSGGCVRQANHKAAALFQWAEIGTVVHAIP